MWSNELGGRLGRGAWQFSSVRPSAVNPRRERTLPSMALHDLVKYVSRLCASRPRCGNLYELAVKYDWNEGDVLAFLRCQRMPPKKMMRELTRELEVSVEDLQRVLNR